MAAKLTTQSLAIGAGGNDNDEDDEAVAESFLVMNIYI